MTSSTENNNENNNKNNKSAMLPSAEQQQLQTNDDYDSDIDSVTEELRCVTFSDTDEILMVVPRISSFSEEELAQIWFESDDFDSFAKEIRKTLSKMERGKPLRDGKYTATGLEAFTPEGRQLKHTYREDAYDAVLFTQDYQYRTKGRRDSWMLARAYQDISKQASGWALIKALRVHEDVETYTS